MSFLSKENRHRKFEVKYFAISHAQNEPAPNHVKCFVPDPSKGENVVKYIEKHPALVGRVIDCIWYAREDKTSGRTYRGYELVIDLYDELITLDVPFKQPPTSMYSLLVKHGENVDWTKEIELSAWEDKIDATKSKNGVCFWQKDAGGNRVTIKSAHTIENPNGCPAPEENEITGKPEWGGVERWLKANFDNVVIPRIKAAAKDYVPLGKTGTNPGAEFLQDEEQDYPEDAYDMPEFAGEEPIPIHDLLVSEIKNLFETWPNQQAIKAEINQQLGILGAQKVQELSDDNLRKLKTGIDLWVTRNTPKEGISADDIGF